MNSRLFQALKLCETDVDGAVQRFSGNEKLYLKYLKAFTKEPTMAELNNAIDTQNWDDAFMAAHALKGLAGNMGFVPLFHAVGELVLLLRAHKTDQIASIRSQISLAYNDVINTLKQFDDITELHVRGE